MLDDNRVFIAALVVGCFVAYALGAAMALLIHRRLMLRYPLPDEPMPEAGPMDPALAAALARAKAQVDAAHEPSDRGQTPTALVALGQDSTTGTIPTAEGQERSEEADHGA